MRVLGFKRLPLAPILALLTFFPLGVEGQLRTVVSNEIAVSESEASLRLGFQDETGLTISFEGGQILVDGEGVGNYERRGDLDLAWRSLLAEVITLDDGPLAIALNDWDPPHDLTGTDADLAGLLDQALEEALTSTEVQENLEPQGEITISVGGEEGLLGALLSRTGALTGLAEALEGVTIGDFILKVGEDVLVDAGEEMEGNLVLVDGDLDVRGRIDGNVVVTGGTVRLLEDGLITGDLRIADGTLERLGGSVAGTFLNLDTSREVVEAQIDLDDLRREMESEIRRDFRSSVDHRDRPSPNFIVGLMGNVGNAIAGLLENLVTFLILAILGGLAVHFQPERLDVVATTARRAPLRSAVVGLAGGFFIVPIWIVGIIALAITIIGIPVLLAWVPLFPIAAGLAILLGYLAVARNVGEWVAEQEYRGLEWIRGSNAFYTMVAGVGALILPAVAASAARILGFGLFTGLFGFVGSVVTLVAASVGLGAVLLTRGGKIRPLESYYDFEEDYWADVEPVEPEPVPNEPSGEEEKRPEPPGGKTEPETEPDEVDEETPEPEEGIPEESVPEPEEKAKDPSRPENPADGGTGND